MTHPNRNRNRPVYAVLALLLPALLAGCQAGPAPSPPTLRVATFNTALSRDQPGALHAAFLRGDDAKAQLVAEVLQRTRPDIVLLQEIDYDPTGKAYADFQRNYLRVAQNDAEPISYPYVYAPPVNTGVLADIDLDGDGRITRPGDCYGYGTFDGQYGIVVLSMHPINYKEVRSFRQALWQDLPRADLPGGYYSPEALSAYRLSSKTHADVPVAIGPTNLHLLVSHPTPPVFDGDEDRNGRRNYDEIGAWLYYLTPASVGATAQFPLMDVKTTLGPKPRPDRLLRGSRFVVMGDLNADPNDGESRPNAISRLLEHDRINAEAVPASAGAREAARLDGGANATHKTDPATDTADWNDTPGRGSGNLRVDYVLPCIDLEVAGSGVYWPTRDDPHAYLNQASDHHLVWIDLVIAPE